MATAAETLPNRPTRHDPVALPERWPWFVRGFQRYSTWYLRRHFHAVRLSLAGHPLPADDAPTLVALNHPAWWDPLICTFLSTLLPPQREHFAAIDAAAVRQYRFFARLGLFGVDATNFRGAAEFVRTGEAVLSAPWRTLWVTAQGEFADVRKRPLGLRSGVGHLASRLDRGRVLPVAIEYAFWNERTPEALVRVGRPLDVAQHPGLNGREWTARIEAALTDTLDGLNADAISRDPARFATALSGKAGVGGVYDGWRRVRAWARGRRFDASHEAAVAAGRRGEP